MDAHPTGRSTGAQTADQFVGVRRGCNNWEAATNRMKRRVASSADRRRTASCRPRRAGVPRATGWRPPTGARTASATGRCRRGRSTIQTDCDAPRPASAGSTRSAHGRSAALTSSRTAATSADATSPGFAVIDNDAKGFKTCSPTKHN